MTALNRAYDGIFTRIENATWILPTLARLIFAGVFLVYFWNSATTKVGDNIFMPSLGAYAQIFPKATEAVGYDISQLSLLHTLIVIAGTVAEFVLPLLIVIGLLTRLAAIGMIGFVAVQSYVDVTGHGLGQSDIGSWFDAVPTAVILDQRALWAFLLVVLIVRGPGPLSIDGIVYKIRHK